MTNNSDSAAEQPSTAVKVTATWPVLRRMIAEMVRPYVGYLIIAGFCMAVVAAGTSGTAWLLDPVVNKVYKFCLRAHAYSLSSGNLRKI